MSEQPGAPPPEPPEPPDPEDDRLAPTFLGSRGHKAYSQQRRLVLAITLGLCVVVLIAVAGLLALTNSAPPPRAVTIPAEDQDAPAHLIREAEAIGYKPTTQANVGQVESLPADAAPATQASTLLPVGHEAPPFTLKTPAGKEISLSDYRGKAVLLEFFATWCPHCAAEAPHLAKLAESMPKDKVAFVSIDGNNENAATVFAYHVYFGLPFPALLDPDPNNPTVSFPDHGSPGPVSRAYQIGFYPTFYVIDPKGKITWRSDGEQPDELIKRELMRAAGA